jgi:hypothetical protein
MMPSIPESRYSAAIAGMKLPIDRHFSANERLGEGRAALQPY